MKKILLIIFITVFILPVSLFAEVPTDEDVLETTSAVLAAFGIIILASMFGESPDGVSANMDMNTGKSDIVFEDFDLEAYFLILAEMTGEAPEDAEMPAVMFRTMSGTIGVSETGDVKCDMSFSGGTVETLNFNTSGESLEYLTANGMDYSHIDLMEME